MKQTVFTHNPFPKVGIRPIIDGRRRGVRESLEAQTMEMANAAAKLISDNLKYPDGSPVECVIADTTIGGRFEAAQCANKFAANLLAHCAASKRPPIVVSAMTHSTGEPSG